VLSRIAVVAFDLDDTLWPCMPTIRRAEEVLYQWLKAHCPRITSRYSPSEMVELRKQFVDRDPRYRIDLSRMRYDFLAHIASQNDYDGGQVSKQAFEVFIDARQQVEFYDDVVGCLERLGQRFRLGAISNGNACVDRVGLGQLIEHSVSASEMQVAKPDRQIYLRLAELFEVSAEQIIYVGDHPQYDVVGSLAAGCQAVWINREGNTWPTELPPPEHQVTDLYQLEMLLDGATP